jgi:hypothetical protein
MEHIWKNSKNLLSIKEAGLFLRCSTKTVYNYLQKGLLEAKKVNGKWAIPVEYLENLSKKEFGKSLEPSETLFEALRQGNILIERGAYEEMLKEIGRLRATEALLVEYKKTNEELLHRVAELEEQIRSAQRKRYSFWKSRNKKEQS